MDSFKDFSDLFKIIPVCFDEYLEAFKDKDIDMDAIIVNYISLFHFIQSSSNSFLVFSIKQRK